MNERFTEMENSLTVQQNYACRKMMLSGIMKQYSKYLVSAKFAATIPQAISGEMTGGTPEQPVVIDSVVGVLNKLKQAMPNYLTDAEYTDIVEELSEQMSVIIPEKYKIMTDFIAKVSKQISDNETRGEYTESIDLSSTIQRDAEAQELRGEEMVKKAVNMHALSEDTKVFVEGYYKATIDALISATGNHWFKMIA